MGWSRSASRNSAILDDAVGLFERENTNKKDCLGFLDQYSAINIFYFYFYFDPPIKNC